MQNDLMTIIAKKIWDDLSYVNGGSLEAIEDMLSDYDIEGAILSFRISSRDASNLKLTIKYILDDILKKSKDSIE